MEIFVFRKINFFQKILQEYIPSVYQTFWIQSLRGPTCLLYVVSRQKSSPYQRKSNDSHVRKNISLDNFQLVFYEKLFCRLLIFFQNQLFQKILSGIPPECQTDWIQIRPEVLSGLIWVQTVCKNYPKMKLEGRVKLRF